MNTTRWPLKKKESQLTMDLNLNSKKAIRFYKVYLHNLQSDPTCEIPTRPLERLSCTYKSRHHYTFKIINHLFKFLPVLPKVMNAGHPDFNVARLGVQHLWRKEQHVLKPSVRRRYEAMTQHLPSHPT